MFIELNDMDDSIINTNAIQVMYKNKNDGYCYSICINNHEYSYEDKESIDNNYERIKDILLNKYTGDNYMVSDIKENKREVTEQELSEVKELLLKKVL